MTTAARNAVESAVTSRTLFRSLTIVVVIICPALVLRVLSVQPSPILSLIAYGAAVVAASFVLAWAAEAAQIDVSGSLAVAVLAVIAVDKTAALSVSLIASAQGLFWSLVGGLIYMGVRQKEHLSEVTRNGGDAKEN